MPLKLGKAFLYFKIKYIKAAKLIWKCEPCQLAINKDKHRKSKGVIKFLQQRKVVKIIAYCSLPPKKNPLATPHVATSSKHPSCNKKYNF